MLPYPHAHLALAHVPGTDRFIETPTGVASLQQML